MVCKGEIKRLTDMLSNISDYDEFVKEFKETVLNLIIDSEKNKDFKILDKIIELDPKYKDLEELRDLVIEEECYELENFEEWLDTIVFNWQKRNGMDVEYKSWDLEHIEWTQEQQDFFQNLESDNVLQNFKDVTYNTPRKILRRQYFINEIDVGLEPLVALIKSIKKYYYNDENILQNIRLEYNYLVKRRIQNENGDYEIIEY